jgi:hypothetical protein
MIKSSTNLSGKNCSVNRCILGWYIRIPNEKFNPFSLQGARVFIFGKDFSVKIKSKKSSAPRRFLAKSSGGRKYCFTVRIGSTSSIKGDKSKESKQKLTPDV